MSFWQILILVLIPCGTITVVAIKGVNFAFGRFKVNAQHKANEVKVIQEQESKEKISSTMDNHLKTMMLIDAKISETMSAICQIKFKETLREQMTYVESKWVQIWGIFSRTFVSLIGDKIKDGLQINLLENSDFKRYTECFDAITLKQVIDFIRSSFKDNHYIELDEEQFGKYVEEKIQVISQMITDILNSSYHGEYITRAEIYKANKEKESEINDMFYDIFLRARMISQEKAKEIEKLLREKNEFIYQIIGVKL